MALVDYAHCSSPIRRYADLHNQHVLASTLGAGGVLDATRLAVLNERAAQVSHYHAMTSAMELAHACRKEPKTFACRVETDEDGTALRVYTERGRVKVPLRDSYFAEPLAAHFAGAAGDVKVQLYGVLKNGRTQLRVRVQEVAAAAPAGKSMLGSQVSWSVLGLFLEMAPMIWISSSVTSVTPSRRYCSSSPSSNPPTPGGSTKFASSKLTT